MELTIKKALIDNAEALFGTIIDEQTIQFQKTRKDVEGDLTLVTFPFVKILRCFAKTSHTYISDFVIERCIFISCLQLISF